MCGSRIRCTVHDGSCLLRFDATLKVLCTLLQAYTLSDQTTCLDWALHLHSHCDTVTCYYQCHQQSCDHYCCKAGFDPCCQTFAVVVPLYYWQTQQWPWHTSPSVVVDDCNDCLAAPTWMPSAGPDPFPHREASLCCDN